MFRPCRIFLYAAALTSAVFAQKPFFIVSPSSGSDVTAGKNITIQLGTEHIIQSGLTVGISSCTPECPGPQYGVGQVIYIGTYTPAQYKDEPYAYENITVNIPLLHDGPYLLKVAGYDGIADGKIITPPLLYDTTEVNVVGSN